MQSEQYQIDRLVYRIELLRERIKELEAWQEKAREDMARMEQAIVVLSEPRTPGVVAPKA